MCSHFKEQQNELRSVKRYSLLADQEERFLKANWNTARARSLWDLWTDDDFIGSGERRALNEVELFDEWEEFALFASHYFFLISNTSSNIRKLDAKPMAIPSEHHKHDLSRLAARDINAVSQDRIESRLVPTKHKITPRIHGVVFQVQPHLFQHHGGYSGNIRLGTSESFLNESGLDISFPEILNTKSIMCHSITRLNENFDHLLVGGRNAPSQPLADCWLRKGGKWIKTQPLPIPLSRHSAVLIGEGVLVYGGISTNRQAMNDWLLWQEETGWQVLDSSMVHIEPRFAATMMTLDGLQSGILCGGMREDGTVLSDAQWWRIDPSQHPPRIIVEEWAHKGRPVAQLCRAGARMVTTSCGDHLLIGGIQASGLPPNDQEIVRVAIDQTGKLYSVEQVLDDSDIFCDPRPLLVGHSAIWDGRAMILLGGGATCFSFNSQLNKNIWKLGMDGKLEFADWEPVNHPTSYQNPSLRLPIRPTAQPLLPMVHNSTAMLASQKRTSVRRAGLTESGTLMSRVEANEPHVFENVELGESIQKWNPEYLKSKIGPDRTVLVHESQDELMTFENRNFHRKNTTFTEFMDAIGSGAKLYLRSLSQDRKQAANFHNDYPEISADFNLPDALKVGSEAFHSSVLRIAGPVKIWLHYDVFANILCQIRGSKKLLLFPPSDIPYLGIEAGKSSSDLDPWDPVTYRTTSLSHCSPREVILKPGDVLFLPRHWAHTAAPLEGTSVAINIFFRDLPTHLYEGSDLNGNKDLIGYSSGTKDVMKIVERFADYPWETRNFYLQRLAMQLLEHSRRPV